MPNWNQVTICGHTGREPELRYLPNNTPVASVSVAINDKWTDGSGQKQERTNWIDVEAFGKLAEVVNQYVGKGDAILVGGKLRQDSWEDRDGNKRSKLKVIADQVQFLGQRGQGGGGTQQRQQSQQQSAPQNDPPPVDDSDIPFSPDGFDGPAWR